MSNHAKPQDPPTPGWDDVNAEVIKDLQERAKMGREKYGTPLQTFNGRRALVDAYQEALDLTLYIKQELLEQEVVNEVDRVGATSPADLEEVCRNNPKAAACKITILRRNAAHVRAQLESARREVGELRDVLRGVQKRVRESAELPPHGSEEWCRAFQNGVSVVLNALAEELRSEERCSVCGEPMSCHTAKGSAHE